MTAHKPLSIKAFLKSNIFLVVFLAFFIILRLPSLFEPHWYGDEGIYASLAYAIEHGKKLYIDVFDNRLPGIYYLYTLATSDSRQFIMRLLNMIAGIVTILGIFFTGKKLGLSKVLYITLAVAVFFLGTPKIEGNIANTENFFIPLTIWGAYFSLTQKKQNIFLAGLLFGAAFMIKFLPTFTLAAIGLSLLLKDRKYARNIFDCLFLAGGFFSAIAAGFCLLFINGNFIQAVQYGLFNNVSYVSQYSTTGIPAGVKLAAFLVLVVGGVYLHVSKKISSNTLFLFFFLLFDYYASLFSGRKYEHYLLQVVPALSISIGYICSYLLKKGSLVQKSALVIVSFIIFYLGRAIFYTGSDVAIRIHVMDYYKEFIMASLKVHYEPALPFSFYREPAQLKVAKYIVNRYNTSNIYFFTDYAWIYDYAHIVPPTFFVARYHQFLVPNGTERLISDLEKNAVEVIAVDKHTDVNPEFNNFLSSRYKADFEDTYFTYYIPLNKIR
jgi:hypothetical protein